MFISSKPVVDTHDDLVSININMSLHKWHWLGQDIVASTNKVNVENKMVPYNTKDSLIVVLGCLRVEFYYYTSLRVRFYGAFCL